ncbi:VWA domain-containing protein [Kibdelosporangium philippinense]|uniref:VWA domain-containing protein n=1 Tax=Kibdelosporangium philippinense TaxID=211113 RepID=A0ABS8ZFC3_9PSEU|nr:VWA domain-containing protein [Kibdelosporangium philippinense]MCE7006516.1 VWA domain-containing protein [Kibdelosporangium philippinense]
MSVPERLVEFVEALREHSILAGPGETVDAARVLTVLGMDDRERVREGLAAALLRRSGQRTVFDQVFDLYFPGSVGGPTDEPSDLESLREQLIQALAAGSAADQQALAQAAVEAFGRFGEGTQGAGGWSAYQTLQRLRPETLLVRVLAALGAEDPGFLADVRRDEIRRQIGGFRRMVETDARRRTAELRGRETVARNAVAPPSDRVDFLTAGRTQLADMRRAIYPLSRKLATRLAARRRRARRGEIDVRRTLRRSIAFGGVPIKPAYRHHRPGRPELVLLCDMSGSVAGFANFTLLLTQALRDQFSKVRAFAFVETTDEVTHLVKAGAEDPAGLATRIHQEAKLTRWDGHSDYTHSLQVFVDEYLDAVGPKTSVLILGDARNNGGDPNLAALRRIARNARHTYWLNPEAQRLWSTGDSLAHEYADVVEMHECRTVHQLSELITRLLPV